MEGLQCTDCHLRVSDSPMGEGHGQRMHTFDVDLATCTQCHGQSMHYPDSEASPMGTAEMMQTAYAPSDEASCAMETGAVTDEPAPQPAQPLNYLLVAAVGMGFGAAVTPLAENWYRRLSSKDE